MDEPLLALASGLTVAPGGTRISTKTKTEAKNKLMALRREQTGGLPVEQRGYTVGEAVESWLQYGLIGRETSTVGNRRLVAQKHVIRALVRGSWWT